MRGAPLIAMGLAALVLAGCAGYRLGPTNGRVAHAKSVQVNAFQNLTPEPRLSEAVAQALRQRFSQEGTFRLATHADGDVVITGTLLRFERIAVAFQPADVITARDFDVTLVARIVAEDRSSGAKLVDREVRGRTTIRVGTDQANSERQALPVLAADLAYNIASLLVDGSW